MENTNNQKQNLTTEEQMHLLRNSMRSIVRWSRMLSLSGYLASFLFLFGGIYSLLFEKPKFHHYFHIPVSNIIYGILGLVAFLILFILARLLMGYSNHLKVWFFTKDFSKMQEGYRYLNTFMKMISIVSLVFVITIIIVSTLLFIAFFAKMA